MSDRPTPETDAAQQETGGGCQQEPCSPLQWGDPVRYLTDDRDLNRRELVIQAGGNGDFYVTVVEEGEWPVEGVRLAMSGGCCTAFPELALGIAKAYRAGFERANKLIQENA